MENINKLTFTTYKINEEVINIPMDDIKQEFDTYKLSKRYLFKILYIAKQLKDGNYIVYLSPMEGSNLPIIKATIPLEIIRTNKIIPNYTYDRPLDKQEKYIVDERVYRYIDKINRRAYRGYSSGYYVLIYGYFVNTYKNNNALTTLKSGIQEFSISSKPSGSFKVTSTKTTTCLISNKWKSICKALDKEYNVPEFKELPKGFFID